MYPLARFILFRLTAEQAHHLVLDQLAKRPTLAKLAAPAWEPSPRLSQEVLGLSFAHPVGLAAAWTKTPSPSMACSNVVFLFWKWER
ncbi:hypothetical protein GCM10025858_30620 [Alicyclobacillus sacchari]|nr:hypothetical protein GCM10025858_30620 [Alicyclobacillus sacchari]